MARDVSRRRRGLLFGGLASLVGGWFAASKSAVANVITGGGSPVTTRMRQGDPTGQPLDTMLLFERGDDNNGRLMTHEVLSLVHEERGKTSHPWTLYTSLATPHET